jgi:hypothetical protein
MSTYKCMLELIMMDTLELTMPTIRIYQARLCLKFSLQESDKTISDDSS